MNSNVILKSYAPGTREWIQQAVLISLFTDARLPADQTLDDGSNDRRGHWADMYLPQDDSLGSLLWTLRRKKLTQAIINRARDLCSEALSWLLNTPYVQRVDITTERLSNTTLAIAVVILLPDNTRFKVTKVLTHAA